MPVSLSEKVSVAYPVIPEELDLLILIIRKIATAITTKKKKKN